MNQIVPLPPKLQLTSNRLTLTIATLGLLGFIDASYLTAKHFLGGSARCFLVEGCDVVTGSQYSTIGGVIPVALLGVLYYSLIVTFIFLHRETGRDLWWRLLAGWSLLGLGFSGWLLYLQAAILGAYCFYCLVSAGISILIFLLVFSRFITRKKF